MAAEQPADFAQQALQASERDLPRLWEERQGQWVAYHGQRVMGFSPDKQELDQQCFQQELKRDEFVVFCIEAHATEMVLYRR